jgi:hypothetical protein
MSLYGELRESREKQDKKEHGHLYQEADRIFGNPTPGRGDAYVGMRKQFYVQARKAGSDPESARRHAKWRVGD